jgi:hypothetical protein
MRWGPPDEPFHNHDHDDAPRGSNPTSNTRDNIFADSLASELASVSGDPSSGYTATFRIAVAA